MRKYALSNSDIAEVNEIINREWPKAVVANKLKSIQVTELDKNRGLLVGENFVAAKVDKHVLPLLTQEEVLKSFPSVSVDKGAVKFVCNGARVMRPGIVQMDEFKKDDVIVVKDVTYGKYLAVGLALVSSEEAKVMSSGPVVDNKHYISDEFWEAHKTNK